MEKKEEGTELCQGNSCTGENIIFSWSKINIYTNVRFEKNFCGIFKSRSSSKHIIKNGEGIAHPGEILAILGSSGSGKTTLLNALTFRTSKQYRVSGKKLFNGYLVDANTFLNKSGYVQQQELFLGNLTVKEHLIFQALIRMNKNVSYCEKIKHVEDIMSELHLQKCQNTKIGIPGRISGISGGEKKRLAIASKLLTEPAIIICDEPTTGLDTMMALNVVQILKKLALKGKTVICTIHQPSSQLFQTFDKILLMANGRTAFYGTKLQAEIFFNDVAAPCPKNYNPADYYLKLISVGPEQKNNVCDKYHKSKFYFHTPNLLIDHTNLINQFGIVNNNINWFQQFKALLWRSWLCVIHNPDLIKVRLTLSLFSSLLFGVIGFKEALNIDGVMSINGITYFMLLNISASTYVSVIHFFCSEIPFFLEEHKSGLYRVDAYFFSKTLAELPFHTLNALIYACVTYFFLNLKLDVWSFLAYCYLMLLVTNVASSFGYMISSLFRRIENAIAVGNILFLFVQQLGGFYLSLRSVSVFVKYLSYTSWIHFAFEAFLINHWKGVMKIDCSDTDSICFKNGTTIIEMYSFSENNTFVDIGALITLFIISRLLALIGLFLQARMY